MSAPQPRQSHKDALEARLDALLPMREPDDVRWQRVRLLKSSDLAMRRLGNPRQEPTLAMEIDRLILEVASAHALRLAPSSRLNDAADLCLSLRICATKLEALEARDAY